MQRRELLEQVGVSAGAATAGVAGIVAFERVDDRGTTGLAGGEPRDEPRQAVPSRYADEFDTIVDASGSGADPTGEEPIDDFLAEYAGESTLLTFTPGTYSLDPVVFSGLSRFGIVGLGEERPTFVPSNASCYPGDAHLAFDGVEEFVLEDVNFDFQRDDSGGSIHVFADGDVALRNLELTGHCPGQIASMRLDIRDEDAEAVVENLVASDERRDSQLTGVYVGRTHEGSLTFRDCDVSGFSDNGLYASSPGLPGGGDGSVEVVGGTYADNNISNVRVGSTGSVVRDVTIDVQSPPSLDGTVNARGIRLRNRGDHLIEGCDITIAAEAGGFGAIVFHANAGGAEVRNTTIDINADSVNGINALEPSGSGVPGPVVENVSITGRAATGYAADLWGRDGTVFRNCTIEQNGYDRGGIRLANAADCEIVDSEITTTGEPIRLRGASASIRDTTIATAAATRRIDSLEARNEVVTP